MNCLMDFIGSDFFANAIALIELIVAIVALLIGGKKVSELLRLYQEKRREATFGFYANLACFTKRIRNLISASDGSPLKTLNLLSPSQKLASIKGYDDLGDKLSAVSLECLQYLSSMTNQIPPATTNTDRQNWKKTLDQFIKYLNDFYLIGTGISLPELSTKDGIDRYYNAIKEILDKIEYTAEEEAKKFFDDLIQEHN